MLLDEEPNYIDVHETTFAWIMPKQARQVMIMDVSGGIKGLKNHFRRMRTKNPSIMPQLSRFYHK